MCFHDLDSTHEPKALSTLFWYYNTIIIQQPLLARLGAQPPPDEHHSCMNESNHRPDATLREVFANRCESAHGRRAINFSMVETVIDRKVGKSMVLNFIEDHAQRASRIGGEFRIVH